MNNFQVIIDYTYKLDESNLVGAGKRGKVYKYKYGGSTYIIKYDNSMEPIINKPVYSEIKNPFGPTSVPSEEYDELEKLRNKYFSMSTVVNQLPHFVKIKGFVVFPNLIWKKWLTEDKIYCSCLYENVGRLKQGVLPMDKQIANQLYGIYDSFRKFNLAGYFHDDIQGCNNIEFNDKSELYVLDYDVSKINDGDKISLQKLLADVSHMYTCAMRYMSHNKIINDIEGAKPLAIYLMREYLKTKPTIKDENNMELKIKKINGFYYQETSLRKPYNELKNILSTGYNLSTFYGYAGGEILKDLLGHFDDFKNDLRLIKSVNVDINKFAQLLENYVDNYNLIIDFLEAIKQKPNLSDNEKEIITNTISLFHDITLSSILLFIGDTEIYFRDAKQLLNSLYRKQINSFKNYVDNTYYKKYLLYNLDQNLNSSLDIYKVKYLRYANSKGISLEQVFCRKYLLYKAKYLKLKNLVKNK